MSANQPSSNCSKKKSTWEQFNILFIWKWKPQKPTCVRVSIISRKSQNCWDMIIFIIFQGNLKNLSDFPRLHICSPLRQLLIKAKTDTSGMFKNVPTVWRLFISIYKHYKTFKLANFCRNPQKMRISLYFYAVKLRIQRTSRRTRVRHRARYCASENRTILRFIRSALFLNFPFFDIIPLA